MSSSNHGTKGGEHIASTDARLLNHMMQFVQEEIKLLRSEMNGKIDSLHDDVKSLIKKDDVHNAKTVHAKKKKSKNKRRDGTTERNLLASWHGGMFVLIVAAVMSIALLFSVTRGQGGRDGKTSPAPKPTARRDVAKGIPSLGQAVRTRSEKTIESDARFIQEASPPALHHRQNNLFDDSFTSFTLSITPSAPIPLPTFENPSIATTFLPSPPISSPPPSIFMPSGQFLNFDDQNSEMATCKQSNPQKCGCPNVGQADYRGNISQTADGVACLRWDETISYKPEKFPNAGLEENYCRNPEPDTDTMAWCMTDGGVFGYCNVPVCGPSCEGSDPEICGCANVLQSDYRGTINITKEGVECKMWNETESFNPADFPEAGLENNNFCRNPAKYDVGTWCFTGEGSEEWDYCDVPVCDACKESNPETCGCANFRQVDYRGTINVTWSGLACKRWDESVYHIPEDYPNAGLENNFCRNPNPEFSDGAWCNTEDTFGGQQNEGWDYCDVPVCGSASTCEAADSETCGCENVGQSDYRGTINVTIDGLECIKWDDWDGIDVKEYPNAGLEDNNFCRSPDNIDEAWCATDEGDDYCDVPVCDPCTCMTPRGETNTESCSCPSILQAKHCENGDDKCRCNSLKEACTKSMEMGKRDYCDDAGEACCRINDSDCRCNIIEEVCYEKQGNACAFAAEQCCSTWSPDSYHSCKCDFSNYAETNLEYDINNITLSCSIVGSLETGRTSRYLLENIYNSTGGDDWFNNSGWLDEEIPHCQWFGISCNENEGVSEINLENNNLIGYFPSLYISQLYEIKSLYLAKNSLSGSIDFASFYANRWLSHMDISNNDLSGGADILFSPAASNVNFSHNNFEFIKSFKQFNPSYETLETCDLSNNRIDQDVSTVFHNIPPNLRTLILSNNAIHGYLPNTLPILEEMRSLFMDNNNMNGTLPDFPRALPQLRELNLSNQAGNMDGNSGFSGSIPAGFSSLPFLAELDLSNNQLTGIIPPDIGSIAQLELLNLSSNTLSQSIPTELGKLEGVINLLDLSENDMEGRIPFELGNLQNALILLGGNKYISYPSPLTLCYVQGFDLKDNAGFCPPERNALKEFYDLAKGGEWTESNLWIDEYMSYCSWYGVACDGASKTAMALNLTNNGLSGKLSTSIGNLSSLNILDLSDNDMKGPIPSEFGLLSNLKYLRLSYNSFTGTVTEELLNLKQLELVQLHGNRISGEIPSLNVAVANEASFITDCGVPTEFEEPLICEECTMCCNSQGDCNPNEKTKIQQKGFDSYEEFTWVFFVCIFGFACVIATVSYIYGKCKKHKPRTASRQSSVINRDKLYALENIGEKSVYRFFLGKSWCGWSIALAVMAVQIWILFSFVKGAEFDLSDDNSDFVYTWKCPRDRDECDNKADLNGTGWAIFSILMASHLMKDFVNGSKMIVLCAKERHSLHTRVRFFFGGMFLSTVTAFTLFTSTIYNKAIATSNTEIIMNAVVILFITDLDEQFFDFFEAIHPSLVGWLSRQKDEIQQPEEIKDNSTFLGAVSHLESGERTSSILQSEKEVEAEHKQKTEKRLEIVEKELLNIRNEIRLAQQESQRMIS